MRYEVIIMMAVVGAINVIGRIMAKRAKDRLAAEQANAIEAKAESRPVARRRMVVAAQAAPGPAPAVRQTPAREVSAATPRVAVPVVTLPAIVPPRVASPSMAALGQAKVAKANPVPARRVRARWSALRMRDGLVASEILGPPVSLRG